MRHLFIAAAALLAALTACKGETAQPAEPTCDDVILHAWCWSFATIQEYLPEISKAGFTIVQTSPAQLCITETADDPGGGPELYGHGRWYYQYQPRDWKIGNYQLGTRDDLAALCDEAKKYGIRIIVDVLPNHTAIDERQVADDLNAAVGGHENLYHANGRNEIVDYNDRYECTTGRMGGLPDVNTENPDFQYYYMEYVNDLLACGVRGFRYDTAKHIGLPSDPVDENATENDFWDVALGRKDVNGLKLALPYDSLFVYGEVLQDKNVKEDEYSEYMRLTASNYGYILRNALSAAKWHADNITDWCHLADPMKLVTWVESHDTYCNEHLSAGLTDDQIKVAWAFLTARQHGTPLFYSRPAGSTRDNYWGDNIVGACGNDSYRHPEVAAVNTFRRSMSGQPETLYFSDSDYVAEVCRGDKGALLANISQETASVTMPTTLPDGTYTDAVYGAEFKVEDGNVTGVLSPLTTYVIAQ